MCRCHFVHLLEKRTLQGCRSSLAKTRAEKHDGKDNNIVTSNFVSVIRIVNSVEVAVLLFVY